MCSCTCIVTLFAAFCFIARAFGNFERTDADIAGTESPTLHVLPYSDGSSRCSMNGECQHILYSNRRNGE